MEEGGKKNFFLQGVKAINCLKLSLRNNESNCIFAIINSSQVVKKS